MGADPVKVTKVAVVLSVFLVITVRPQVGVLALIFYILLAGSLDLETLTRGLGVTMVKSIGLYP